MRERIGRNLKHQSIVQLGARHQQVLAGLENIFLAEGVKAVSVGELADRLNCSRSTLYDIAPTKKELFHTVLRCWTTKLRDAVSAVAEAQDDPFSKLSAIFQTIMDQTQRESPSFLADADADPIARDIVDQHLQCQLDFINGIIQAGMSSGVFYSFQHKLAADLVMTLTHRYRDPALLKELGLSMTDAYLEIEKLLFHGLLKKS